jgi:hypothetical protein
MRGGFGKVEVDAGSNLFHGPAGAEEEVVNMEYGVRISARNMLNPAGTLVAPQAFRICTTGRQFSLHYLVTVTASGVLHRSC